MGLKAIIFGSSGMTGKGLLLESLDNPAVESILLINRNSIGIRHKKISEIIHKNFFDISPLEKELGGYNACFYCIGITSAGISEEAYHKNTYELTIHIAETVLKKNKDLVFCYISGAGSDRTETGKVMWARIKGKTENKLLSMPFKHACMFRPAYIQPMKGVRSRTRLYNILYSISKPFYFLLKPFKRFVTDSVLLAKAMINVASKGYEKEIIESRDINIFGQDQGRHRANA